MKNCFETIKIEDNQIYNLFYHNQRLNNTRKSLFGSNSDLDLADFIDSNHQPITKCKVIYDDEILDVQYSAYTPKNQKSFKLIESSIDYDFKYNDRTQINDLYELRGSCDDIIIFKNGLLTDTSIANIGIFYNNKWLTPKKPLLNGTFKSSLIKSNFLQEYDIDKEILKVATKFAIINAMVGFKEIDDFQIDFNK